MKVHYKQMVRSKRCHPLVYFKTACGLCNPEWHDVTTTKCLVDCKNCLRTKMEEEVRG